MIEATIGLPDSQAAGWSGIVVIGALAFAAVALAALPAERRVFPALAIFGLPLVQVLLGIPNEQYARFHLVSCIGLVVLIAEVGSLSLSSRSTARPVAIAILALSLAGSTIGDARLIRDGRGSFARPVAIMGAQGPASVIVRPAILAGETGGVVRWYADRLNAPVTASNTPCPSNADWLLVVREPGDALDAPPQDLGDTPDCRARFVPHRAYPAYGLSGFTWLLFRRETR